MILDQLRAGCDSNVGSEWTVGVDSSVIRAHQHAAGARHQPPKDIPAERLAPMLPPDPQPEVSAPPEGHTGGGGELQEFCAAGTG